MGLSRHFYVKDFNNKNTEISALKEMKKELKYVNIEI